jgi:hypothetical protein
MMRLLRFRSFVCLEAMIVRTWNEIISPRNYFTPGDENCNTPFGIGRKN